MKHATVIVLITVLVVIIALLFVAFEVRETEYAIVFTFGKPGEPITKPGLHFHWPWPISTVQKFDARMRVFAPELSETTTKGAVPIIVNTYVVWRIVEPLSFFNSIGTLDEAETKLRSLINDTQNRTIGRHAFSEFVNRDKSKIKFEEIENEMLQELRASVANANYGIEIKALGIKQLKISKDVTKDVFERMRAERNRQTESTLAEGLAEAEKIKSDADSKAQQLKDAAQARADAIRGEGDARAAEYYKMLEADPELAIFLRNLESAKQILAERSTVIISGDAEPFKLLKEIPKLGSAENK